MHQYKYLPREAITLRDGAYLAADVACSLAFSQEMRVPKPPSELRLKVLGHIVTGSPYPTLQHITAANDRFPRQSKTSQNTTSRATLPTPTTNAAPSPAVRPLNRSDSLTEHDMANVYKVWLNDMKTWKFGSVGANSSGMPPPPPPSTPKRPVRPNPSPVSQHLHHHWWLQEDARRLRNSVWKTARKVQEIRDSE